MRSFQSLSLQHWRSLNNKSGSKFVLLESFPYFLCSPNFTTKHYHVTIPNGVTEIKKPICPRVTNTKHCHATNTKCQPTNPTTFRCPVSSFQHQPGSRSINKAGIFGRLHLYGLLQQDKDRIQMALWSRNSFVDDMEDWSIRLTLFSIVSLRKYSRTKDPQELCWSQVVDRGDPEIGENKTERGGKTLGKPNWRQLEIRAEILKTTTGANESLKAVRPMWEDCVLN